MEEKRQECEARRAADRGGSAMETQRRMAQGQGTRGTRSPSSLLRTANSTSATALESFQTNWGKTLSWDARLPSVVVMRRDRLSLDIQLESN